MLMYLAAFPRLARYVRRIDYNVYCSQPVFNEVTRDRWKTWAAALESRASRKK